MPNERKYNFIFSKLVQEPNDLVGLLAYGIYKREKIDFINSFRSSNARGPNDDELQNFHDISIGRTEQYRRLAESDLSDFQNTLIEEHAAALSADYDLRFKRELAQVKTTWWAAITQSFLGSIVFSVFIGIIVIIVIGMRYGISGLVNEGMKMLSGQ